MAENSAKKWLVMFLGIYILVQFVSATGGTLLASLTGLNTTFGSTGLGNLFAANIIGIILVVAIFYVVWKMIGK